MTRTLALTLAVPAALLAILGCGTSQPTSQASTPPAPTATLASHAKASQHAHSRAHRYLGRVLPACKVEDGNGQALCWWDAKRRGNHKGRSVISGDCAPSVMGNVRTVRLCVKLHAQRAYDVTYQGAVNHTPAGPALIDECVSDARTEGSGYLAECLAAWIK